MTTELIVTGLLAAIPGAFSLGMWVGTVRSLSQRVERIEGHLDRLDTKIDTISERTSAYGQTSQTATA